MDFDNHCQQCHVHATFHSNLALTPQCRGRRFLAGADKAGILVRKCRRVFQFTRISEKLHKLRLGIDSELSEKMFYLLAADRLLLVVRDGEGEILELNCSPCPSQHNLLSCNGGESDYYQVTK